MLLERRDGPARETCHIDALVQVASAKRIVCVVENVSDRGAKLRFRKAVRLPSSFSLILPTVGRHRGNRLVELRWCVGTAAGVQFIG